MTETPARKPRPRRTFSAFGDVRRMPSEYEIVTHAQNWTLRQNRAATFEQNPSSAPNLWFLTYRDNTPLKAADWDAFRDPDALTYKAYVNLQADAETRVRGVLEAHAEDGADANLDPAAVTLLGRLFTPSRYLCHGFQQVEAYLGYMAPSSYITNAAAFATADFLRRVTTIAYRTRELQIARPDSGIGTAERSLWEGHEGWQPARKAVEYALVTYDFGEAFTALNLVLAPTLDDVLLTQLGRTAKGRGDDLTWLLTSFLAEDSRRAAGGAGPWPTWPWPSARTTGTCWPSGSAAGPRGPTRPRWAWARSWRPPPGFPRQRSPPTPEARGNSSSPDCSRPAAPTARRKPADHGDRTLAGHDQPR
jgi:toluene monooxygenase system protein E